jgi:hypothetical protein
MKTQLVAVRAMQKIVEERRSRSRRSTKREGKLARCGIVVAYEAA